MGEGAFWNDLNITFHATSLHICERCESEGRLSKGQHKDWCNLIKKSSGTNAAYARYGRY